MIINMSGVGAAHPLAGGSAYGASTPAVLRLTETLAHELRRVDSQLCVVAMGPGLVRTEMTQAQVDSAAGRAWIQSTAMSFAAGKTRPPEDCARSTVDLLRWMNPSFNGRAFQVGTDFQELAHETGGGELASPAAARARSTLRHPLFATAAGTTAASVAAVLPLGVGTDDRTLVDAALARACIALTGAGDAAAAAVTGRAASSEAAVDRRNEGHEAQRRPKNETIHGKTLCARRNRIDHSTSRRVTVGKPIGDRFSSARRQRGSALGGSEPQERRPEIPG